MRGKSAILILVFIICVSLWAKDTILQENKVIEKQITSQYTVLSTSDRTIYASDPGNPAIPLAHRFFEIPANSRIASVQIIPLNSQQQVLTQPLYPIQKAYPLSYEGTVEFTPPNDTYNQRSLYPQNYLHHFGDGYCGGHHIGYVTYYTAEYEPYSKTLTEPAQFNIEITYSQGRNDPPIHNTEVTNEILQSLGLNAPWTESDSTGYLIIYPAAFADAYAPLVEWRRSQGLKVLATSLENIYSSFGWVGDTQATIRAYIHYEYNNEHITYVTLGADTDRIPDRKLFAFNCDFGYQNDESVLPADMYYGNLGGNFDENNNGIYGEDDDDPDFFPEVFVGRISANTPAEASDYVTRLIAYEKGHLEDYNKSLGLAMDLWPGANSVQCQQYIENKYFPSNYQNTILNEDENTTANALAAMHNNPNIIMHTGHANHDVIGLRHGYIDNTFMSQLNNQYGGLFNSIGCWAEAIDYNSIGEKMVMTPGKGMLAFVGNSRFGWGSPLAPGFGYSEFYQKEFFRLLFKQQVNHIAATNALQKIPFVPYFYGTSVYKWCAYELNEEGDSYFRLFTDNPKPMTCNAKFYESMNMFEVNVTSEGQPVPNAILYFAEEDTVFITDNSGRVNIQCSGINNFPFEAFSIYAENCMNIDSPSLSEIASIAHHPFLNGLHFERVSEDKLCQGISYHGAISLLNNFAQSISGFVDIITDPSMVEISNTHIPFQVDGGDWKTIRFNAWVKSIDQIGQLPDGTPIQFEVRVISDSLADDVSEKYYYQVITPVITLESLNFDAESISPGEYFPFTMTFSLPQSYMNYSYNFTHLDVTLSSDVVTFAQNVQSTCFRNEYNGPTNSYAKIGNYISIPSDAVEGQILPFHAKAYLIWNFLFYTFDFDLAISVGRLKYFNDFEHVLDLTGDSAWQRVPATYILGVSNYALSCRPSVYGTYNISTPNFVYQDSTRVSFRYKYKMPMYGKDGVFVKLIRGNDAENLIFLGSGGALGRVNNDDYISSDPATYQLDLASLSQLNLQPGDLFHIEFSFVYADTSGFNDYTNMPDVGVFIDDLEISNRSQMDLNVSIATPEIRINSYPNPIGQFDLLKIDILNWDYTPNPSIIVIHKDPQYSVEIYNIRGQRVYKNRGVTTANIPKKLVWDLKGVDGKKVGSGVYILRVKSGEKVVTKKITIVK